MTLIVSLQYSPIYMSHSKGLGDALELQRKRVRYLLNSNYSWMLPPEMRAKTTLLGNASSAWTSVLDWITPGIRRELRRIVSQSPASRIYAFNLHPFLNRYFFQLARRHGWVCIQHVQEPYVEDKKLYGGFRRLWLPLFELLQEATVKHADMVVLSSERSVALFETRYPNYGGQRIRIPLMYEDMGVPNPLPATERQFVTFVGPPSRAKGTETFLRIVGYCYRHGLNYHFVLISGRGPRRRLHSRFRNLTIVQETKIPDAEVANLLRRSVMTLTPYTVATQSSVIPVSYMYGTPVVSSNVGGLPEEVAQQQTGMLLDPRAPVEDWIRGMDYVRERLPTMIVACRRLFERRYSAQNWASQLDLLEE